MLNCNYIEKVLQPIKSRCPVVNLKFDKKDLLMRLKHILDTENVKYTKDALKSFIESAFKLYPDIRRIISYLQSCCASGELLVNDDAISDNDKNELVSSIVSKAVSEEDLLVVRKAYLSMKDKISDYAAFGAEVFNYVVDHNIVSNSDGLLKLADIMYYLNQVIDKESMFFGMLVAIRKYGTTR